MAMVDVDGSSQFSADSQPKSTGLVWVLAATRCSVYIHQMNRVNSRNDFGYDDSTIVVVIIIMYSSCAGEKVSSKLVKRSSWLDEQALNSRDSYGM